MKKILIVIGCGLTLGYFGCKEVGPVINLSPGATAGDSVYSLSPTQIASLTTDPHNVLVEEFTGQTCSNCPSAHASLDAIALANTGRINTIGLYMYNIPQANPLTGVSVYDLRDSDATKIGQTVYGGVAALPSGGVDRMLGTDGKIITDRTNWAANISSHLSIIDSANLALKSSFDAATNTAKIVATVTYTQQMTTKQNLTVVVVEDSMVDIQEEPGGGIPPYLSGYDTFYVFTNACRGTVSAAIGDPVLDTMAVKAKGVVLQRTFLYKLKTTTPAIKPAHCRVIGFLSNTSGSDPRVLQSAQTKFAP